MGISRFFKNHGVKIAAGVAIGTAAVIIYNHHQKPSPKSPKSKCRANAQPKCNLLDIESQHFSAAFNRQRRRETKGEKNEVACESLLSESNNSLATTIQDEKDLPCESRLTATVEPEMAEQQSDQVEEDGEDDEDEDEDDEEENDDQTGESRLDAFGDVFDEVDLEKLQDMALTVRTMGQDNQDTISQLEAIPNKLSCKLDLEPLCGAYNLLLRIDFSDGVKVLARMPGHGRRFGPEDVHKMYHEYQTQRYIAKRTSIPVPEVAYVTTSIESMGVPFALISFVEGRSLHQVWHSEMNEEQRFNVLSEIAGDMAKLHKLKFDQIGGVEFDEDVQPTKVGPHVSVLHEGDCAWAHTSACISHHTHRDYFAAIHDGCDHMPLSVRADNAILRIAVETMPPFLTNETKFPLGPEDFNYQNILVDENYRVTSFVDWDGVGTNATVSGCGRFPSWITRDWDPLMYSYNPDAPIEGSSAEEHSPQELAAYRRHYAAAFASHADDLEDYDPRMTSLSHVVEAITIGLSNYGNRGYIINKMFDIAFARNPPFTLGEYCDTAEVGDTSEMDQVIRKAFAQAWANEWREEELEFDASPANVGGPGSSYADLRQSEVELTPDVSEVDDVDEFEDPSFLSAYESEVSQLQINAYGAMVEDNMENSGSNGKKADEEDDRDVDQDYGYQESEEDNLKAFFASQTAQLELDSLTRDEGKPRESLSYQEEALNHWTNNLY